MSHVVLSFIARDVGRGQAAVEELKKEGLNPKFHLLDLEDNATIQKLAAFLQENYGGLDLLVNNAGIAYKVQDCFSPYIFFFSPLF